MNAWISRYGVHGSSLPGLMTTGVLSAMAGSQSEFTAGELLGITSPSAQRDQIYAALDRADVAAALQERGVDLEQARARVAALTDDEVAQVAHTIETAPAGASDILGVLVFIFVLLLVTDILGLTKVFPFTRSVR